MQSHPPSNFDGDDPTWAIAATSPDPAVAGAKKPATVQNNNAEPTAFIPRAPKSFAEAGVRESVAESLALKFLLNSSTASGREIADQIAMPFGVIEPLLHRLKHEQLVVFKSSAPVGDYQYELTAAGGERARRFLQQSSYFGAAPVPLEAYMHSVQLQSLTHRKVTMADVERAFGELVLDERMLNQVGEGINKGLGFFLYGEPGNGKTSIAERVASAYGDGIWIARAINVGGEIVRLFDPANHELIQHPAQDADDEEQKVDQRWVFIRRPTIVGGGELRLSSFEVTTNPVTGIHEAPLQLKANGGTLVIDDFGRQHFRPEDLLNRLIVPLELRVDFLNMPSGRTFRVPYDVMTVISTNLDPLSLVDEAFLRRIPYKVDVNDPSEAQFREVFREVARRKGISCSEEALNYVIQKHYRDAKCQMRFCHPRDLLEQVYNACDFRNQPLVVTP
ncbi:MAG: AAA family ATPase, partial [Planctomycetota bacterium]|nr:AAA family ATPase [Planctomycetota bacterium]